MKNYVSVHDILNPVLEMLKLPLLQVKVFKLSDEGKEQVLHVLEPGQSFAEAAIFEGGVYPAHAEALADSEILLIAKRAFIPAKDSSRILDAVSDHAKELQRKGGARDRERLERLAEQVGVRDSVRFLGAVDDQDLPALYNLGSVYVGASRRSERLGVEGFGIALVEASACGLPVVAGTSGGIPDAVRDGDSKLLVNHDGTDAQLYNIPKDISEQHDVAAANPELVKSLTAKAIGSNGTSTTSTPA